MTDTPHTTQPSPLMVVPTYNDARDAVQSGTYTALERFVYEYEPAGSEDTPPWRVRLGAILSEAIANARPENPPSLAAQFNAPGPSNPLFPIAADSRVGKSPCGECRLQPGEQCDICGVSFVYGDDQSVIVDGPNLVAIRDLLNERIARQA